MTPGRLEILKQINNNIEIKKNKINTIKSDIKTLQWIKNNLNKVSINILDNHIEFRWVTK